MHHTDFPLDAWLRLEQTPGLGLVRARRLLQQFGSPQAVLAAGHAALAAVVPAPLARLLCAPATTEVTDYIGGARLWLSQPGNHLLTPGHPAYPALLDEIADPPIVLYAKGRVELLNRSAIAIVGSRNATIQGNTTARRFAAALSEAGVTIVSGLALGIDAAAHEGALSGVGATVAVIGTGADRIYPRRNDALARRIAAEGCVLSEYSLGIGPLAANFPRRNRLISGLCRGVLVVEAAAASGSLITAHVANEQGREVFAIPGSIHSALSKGCHKLIKEGAMLVESVDDLLEALQVAPRSLAGQRAPGGAEPDAALDAGLAASAPLLAALGQGPVHGDVLATLTDAEPGLLASQLLALELAGHVERLPGGLFQRVNR